MATAAVLIIIVSVWWLARGQSRGVRGTAGVVRENTVVCPRCNMQFNYQFVPGASFTSLRLGKSRYMRCPLCGKWSVIKIVGQPAMPPYKTSTTKKGY
jgi:hypothetical protein